MKSNFRAGIHRRWPGLVGIAAIVVAAIAGHYALPWYEIALLELVVVVIPALLVIRIWG